MLALAVLALQTTPILFARTYKVNQVAKYRYSMTFQGQSLLDDEIETKVSQVEGPNATVHYKVRKLNITMPGGGALPELDSKVGPQGMPDQAKVKSSEEFFIFLAAAGIAPNQKVSVGDQVATKWTNESGDASFDCEGQVLSIDSKSKTMAVDWTLTLTSPDSQSEIFKLTSTYSTLDCSLLKSEGTMNFAGVNSEQAGEVKVVKEA